jgi:hypothetical protein
MIMAFSKLTSRRTALILDEKEEVRERKPNFETILGSPDGTVNTPSPVSKR